MTAPKIIRGPLGLDWTYDPPATCPTCKRPTMPFEMAQRLLDEMVRLIFTFHDAEADAIARHPDPKYCGNWDDCFGMPS